MSTPDTLAAGYDPEAEAPESRPVAELDGDDIGAIIEISGVTAELTGVIQTETGHMALMLKEDGRPFEVSATLPPETLFVLVEPAPTSDDGSAVVDMTAFYALARELDEVSKALKANGAEKTRLEGEKRDLSAKMLGTFAQLGESRLYFGERRAYIHTEVVPELQEKGDGTKFTWRDLVPVLREIGRGTQVTPETVAYQTVQSILREFRDSNEALPAELAAMVVMREVPEVRTGVGTRKK